MADTILTKSHEKGYERSIELEKPELLKAANLDEIIEIIGADLAFTKIMSQLVIDFRSHIRTKLASRTDEEFNNTDKALTALDFSEWKPETRTRMTAEEKAAKALSALDPDQIAAVIAKMAAAAEAAAA